MDEERTEEGAEQTTDFEERRKAYRLNKVLGATLEHGEEITQARLFIIDISVSGFRATSHVPLPDGERLKVGIALSADQKLEGEATIVWQRELTVSGMFQLGCEFHELDDEQEAKLASFIEAERNKVAKPQKKGSSMGRPWTMIKD